MRYASHRLIGEAKRWWQSKKDLLILELGLEHAITWEICSDEFHKQFFTGVVYEAKDKKFMDLVQGSMSNSGMRYTSNLGKSVGISSYGYQGLMYTSFQMRKRRSRSSRQALAHALRP